MRFSDLLFLFFTIFLAIETAYAQSGFDITASIHRLYGKHVTTIPVQPVFTAELTAKLNTMAGGAHPWEAVEIHRVISKDSSIGWAFIDNVKGKSRPITYLLCFDQKAQILDLEILKYRETHGGEVAGEMFRSQFRGKGNKNRLLVGRDIRNISGATISVRSVTKGVKALSALALYLSDRKEE